MTTDQAKFESYSWWVELQYIERTYKVLDGFLGDEKAQEVYLRQSKKNIMSLLEDEIEFLPQGPQIFRRQILVLLKVYLEAICNGFLTSLYGAKGQKPPSKKLNFPQLIEAIEKQSGLIIPPKTKNELLQLNKIRNNIAHEINQEQIDESFLLNSIDTVHTLVKLLQTVCLANNIIDVNNLE